MSGQDIIIKQLREELEKAHAASEYQTRRIEHYRTQLDFCERRAEKAERERDVLRHHYEEAIPEHNLFALLDMYDGRRAAAESERDEALAERDARPDISAEDALLMEDARATLELPAYEHGPEHQDAAMRIARAIRAHAAKSVKP